MPEVLVVVSELLQTSLSGREDVEGDVASFSSNRTFQSKGLANVFLRFEDKGSVKSATNLAREQVRRDQEDRKVLQMVVKKALSG